MPNPNRQARYPEEALETVSEEEIERIALKHSDGFAPGFAG